MEIQAIAVLLNPLTETAFARLIKALGRDKGTRQGQAALAHLGVPELANPSDLLRFANHLITQGGVVESVGRALKVTALLRGAGSRDRFEI